MIRFNFLESERPVFLRRMCEFTIPRRLRAGTFAVCAATGIATAAWAIESYRLADAELVSSRYHSRYEQSALALAQAKLVFTNVAQLEQLANRLRQIQLSGGRTARTVAQIGNHIPPHAWVTSESVDERGIVLSGKASDFVTLSREMSQATRYSAELRRASRGRRSADAWPVDYELRLQQAP